MPISPLLISNVVSRMTACAGVARADGRLSFSRARPLLSAQPAHARDAGLDRDAPDEMRMHERFRATGRYEWMFWDVGFRSESWPVG